MNLEDGGQVIRKRDEKAKDKRDIFVEKMIKEKGDATKNEDKVTRAEEEFVAKAAKSSKKKVVDEDLASESEEEDEGDSEE